MGLEEVVDGWFGVEDPDSSNCIWSYNPVVNLPDGVLTSDIRQVSLPNGNGSNFGNIEKILIQSQQEEFFGDAYYLKTDVFTRAGCSDIPANGDYSNVLGTLTSGEQAWYAGHVVLDENTLDNPIADAGSAMNTILDLQTGGSYDEQYQLSICPVASKSFMNGKHSFKIFTIFQIMIFFGLMKFLFQLILATCQLPKTPVVVHLRNKMMVMLWSYVDLQARRQMIH